MLCGHLIRWQLPCWWTGRSSYTLAGASAVTDATAALQSVIDFILSKKAVSLLCCVSQRPLKVKIKAQDINGNKIHRTFNDPWVARVFQHEYDHLQGTLFPDRVRAEARSAVLADLRVLEDAYAKLHPEDVLQRY